MSKKKNNNKRNSNLSKKECVQINAIKKEQGTSKNPYVDKSKLKAEKRPSYFKRSMRELKKTIFPTAKEEAKSTAIVFVFCAAIALVLWGVGTGTIELLKIATSSIVG